MAATWRVAATTHIQATIFSMLRCLLVPLLVSSGAWAQVTPCGPGLCFSGQFNDNALLQRAPAAAVLYGSGATGAVQLTLAGTAGDGSAYNKTFTGAGAADGTWRVQLDPMPTGGNLSAALALAGNASAISTLYNLTFGDVWYCAGKH